MNIWSELQAAALDNLGIPRYELNHAVAPVVETPQAKATPVPVTAASIEPAPTHAPAAAPVASSETAAATTETTKQVQDHPQPVLYQLGPWILQFPQALPVNYYPWLKDLSQFIQSRPTQVSAAGQKAIIDCAFVAKEQLHQDEKRALWQQLKPYLNQ